MQDATINALAERFGCYLDQLDRSQKIQIRVLLTNFLLGQDQMGSDYTIGDAWQDSSLHLLTSDDDVVEVADILVELTIPQAEALLSFLAEQCTVGNSRLKTPIEIATETFVGLGVPEQLATTAAIILKQVDGTRDRTPDEQSTINQIHQVMTASIRQQRQAEATN
ncbi:MAG: hypothetical protein KME46_33580 [Brasilonema angustatum HA4187-MV1]|nr:hypothetical protein [Brasilonema angustatum HA4187-MV1]